MTAPLPNLSALGTPEPAPTATLFGPFDASGDSGPPLLTVKILQADGTRNVVRCLFRFRALSLRETASDAMPAGMQARRTELLDAVERAYDYLAQIEDALRTQSRGVVLTPGPRYDANATSNENADLWRRVFWVLDVEFPGEDFEGGDGDARFSEAADLLSRSFSELHADAVNAFQLEEDYGNLDDADVELLNWYEAQLA
tara:strand:+ start:1742 stop:2341 length:600 start_codon:yes stop_codon:yes gene_type:complete